MKPDKKSKTKSIKLTIPMKPKTKTTPHTTSTQSPSSTTPTPPTPPHPQPPLPQTNPIAEPPLPPATHQTTATKDSNEQQYHPVRVQDDPPPKPPATQQPSNGSQQHEQPVDTDNDVRLKHAVFEDVRQSIARANINDNTLRQYCKAYKELVDTVKSLPNPETGKADDTIEKYVMDQHKLNPRPGSLSKVTQALCMLKIMHPKVYTNLPVTRITLNNWKKSHVPKSATAINTLMARGFASFLHRISEHYAAAALIVQQAACLRPCEVLGLKQRHVRLPGSIALRGAGPRVAALVITNGKTAKNGKPQMAIINDETAIQVLEILIESAKHLSNNAGLFANITYAAYSRHLHTAANYYGFGTVNVTPHGARLGKAVEDFNNRIPLDDIAVGGRWAELQSAIAYIKNGQASLANINIPRDTQEELIAAEKRLIRTTTAKWASLRKRNPGFGQVNTQPECKYKHD